MKIAVWKKFIMDSPGNFYAILDAARKNHENLYFSILIEKGLFTKYEFFCIILNDSYDKNYICLLEGRKYKKYNFLKVYELQEQKEITINFLGPFSTNCDDCSNYLGTYLINSNTFRLHVSLELVGLEKLKTLINHETFKDLV